MNPVLMLTRNCLEQTKRASDSALLQDIPTWLGVIDNGSTDGSVAWLEPRGLLLDASPLNNGVSAGWNHGLRHFWDKEICDHVLVVNNDVVLPPWYYRELLSYDLPFVTGVEVTTLDRIKELPPRMPLVNHPDFSAFLIRRDAWNKIGPFDERMKFYASDLDYHLRAQRLGIKLLGANVPYYHERSSTLNHASPEERAEIEKQANADREVFRSIYGCLPGTPEYDALFK